ncbi:MAG: transglycosylase SLT domain-containing protein [Cytophagaceae bacterium]|nr:transglycosylase SLT domain-containing protein [Cytophagaceae bacterium]
MSSASNDTKKGLSAHESKSIFFLIVLPLFLVYQYHKLHLGSAFDSVLYSRHSKAARPREVMPVLYRFPLQKKELTVLAIVGLNTPSITEGGRNMSYELLKLFAKDKGIKLHLKLIQNSDHLLDGLNAGFGDLAIGDRPTSYAKLNSIAYTQQLVKPKRSLLPGESETAVLAAGQWAVYQHADGLLEDVNIWLNKRQETPDYKRIVKKYTPSKRIGQQVTKLRTTKVKKGQISCYDPLIRRYARKINWEWQLLAALMYQESGFNPVARSGAGAVGLMQLMPATARDFGVDDHQLTTPEPNLKAGIGYLKWLEKKWRLSIKDEAELIKFVLASYNAGMGHVQDAQRLAVKYNLDPLKWEGNVAIMLLKKSKPGYYKDVVVRFGYCRGKEPVNYVKSTLGYYQCYKKSSAVIVKSTTASQKNTLTGFVVTVF